MSISSSGPQLGDVQKNLHCMGGTPSSFIYKRNCCVFMCPTKRSPPLNMYDLMKALKFGIFSIMCGITGTMPKFMYDFMRSGMVEKSSSCNFMLQRPNDALMSWCVCPIIKKNTNIFLRQATTKKKHVSAFVVFSIIIKLNVKSWR